MLKKTKELIIKRRKYILAVFILGLIWDNFINPKIVDSAVLILGLLWILNLIVFKLKPPINLVLAAVCYAIAFLFQFLKKEMIMEKAVSWFFLFLLIFLISRLKNDTSKN